MFVRVLNLLAASISAVVDWFETIFSVTQMTTFYLVMFFMLLVTRFLVMPIMGSYIRANYYFRGRKVGHD